MELESGTSDNNTSKNSQPAKKVVPRKPLTFAKKVDQETAKLIGQIKEKLNKKTFGRSVTDADIIGKAVPLLTAEHFQQLQEDTFSQQDKLKIAFEVFVKENGKVSYEEFLGVLLNGLAKNKKS